MVFGAIGSALGSAFGNMFGNVKNKVSKFFGDPNSVASLKKTAEQWMSGQYHAPGGYNYCGPGTQLNGQKAINGTDSACQVHDYEYDAFKNNRDKVSHGDLTRMIRESDQKLINSIENSGIDDLGSELSKLGIKAKMQLEDWGLMDPLKFI
jgi:hypothetical protein